MTPLTRIKFLRGREYYAFILVGLVLLAGAILLTPSIHGYDGLCNYVYFRSLFFDKDLDFRNEFSRFDELKQYSFRFTDTAVDPETGKYANRYGVGSSLLWSPFLVGLHGALRVLHPQHHWDGYDTVYALGVGLGTVCYGSLGLILLYLFLRRFFSSPASFLSIMAIWLCTPLIFYLYFHPSMSHGNSFLLSTLFLLLYLSSVERRLKGTGSFGQLWSLYASAGLVFGLLVATRLQDVTFLSVLISGESYCAWRRRTYSWHEWRHLLLFFGGAGISFFPQMLCWRSLYGSLWSGPVPYLQYPEFNIFYPRHLFKVLFSAQHGLFYLHPWLVLGIVGLWVKRSWQARLLFVAFLAQLYLISCWQIWHAGASFGHRMFISGLPVFAFGMAQLVEVTRSFVKWWIYALVFGLLVVWHAGLVIQYALGLMPREGRVSYSLILHNQVSKVPGYVLERLPEQVVRRPSVD